ncbi:MAG: UDP-2,3-diacylglucosamine diphosphatase, partial [Deefgea sp.]
ARQFMGLMFGDIKIEDEVIHTMANGKKYLVIHGDQFDGVIQCARWLAVVGDQAYEITLKLNRWFNRARARMGLGYWSLSQYLKHKVKKAVSFVSDFEEAVAAEAKKRELDGVICGHIHKAEMRMIDGIQYCNDGDWVESLTALVEMPNGELRILTWQTMYDAQTANIHKLLSPIEPQTV